MITILAERWHGSLARLGLSAEVATPLRSRAGWLIGALEHACFDRLHRGRMRPLAPVMIDHSFCVRSDCNLCIPLITLSCRGRIAQSIDKANSWPPAVQMPLAPLAPLDHG